MKPFLEWSPPQRTLVVQVADHRLPVGVEIRYDADGPRTWSPSGPADESSHTFRWTTPDLELELVSRTTLGGGRVLWRLRALRPLRLHSVTVARFDASFPGLRDPFRLRVLRQGYQSWTPTGSVAATDVQQYPRVRSFALMNLHVDSPSWGRRDGILSTYVTVLRPAPADAAGATSPSILLGFLGHRAGLGEIFVRTLGTPAIDCTLDYGGKALAAEEILEGEPFRLLVGEPADILATWARETAEEMGVAETRTPSPVGWCSWYEFYARVTEADALRNLAFLGDHPELGVKLFQLDDGYQAAVGDWLTWNEKFPRGLEPLVRDVHARGMKAGLWLAPFFAGRKSALFRNHPDWFLADPRGKPVYTGFNPIWFDRTFALDLTHPEVKGWLRDTFAALVAMGFDYFKLDFLFGGLRHGRRHDPTRSPVEAYRDGLALIREVVGPDRFVLGCGAPLGPSLGLVDAMRVSEDVKERWESRLLEFLGRGTAFPSAKGALRNNMTRFFLHRAWWLNDPDCLLIRDRNTRLSLEETRTLVTVLGMTGGMLLLSDDLPRLAPERLALAEAVLPPSPATGVPADLLERDWPETFVLGSDARLLVARLNPEDRTRVLPLLESATPGLPPGWSAGLPPGTTLFDFWHERVLPADEATAGLQVGPHGCAALLATAPCDEPTPVGTTLHLTALADGRLSATFDAARATLHVSCRDVVRRKGRIWIRVPAPWSLVDDAIPAGGEGVIQGTWVWRGGVMIEVEAPPPWRFALPFHIRGAHPACA